jgi:polar amino acid transport system substrate-binding protein
MKNILMLIVLSCLSVSVFAQGKFVVAYEDFPNPPFYLGSGELVNAGSPGITIEVLQIVAERLSLDIEFIRVPWKRALMLLEKNEIDGLFHASYKESRLQFGLYPMKAGLVDESRKLMMQSYVLYYTAHNDVQWDGHTMDVHEMGVSTTLGYSIVEDLQKLGVSVHESYSAQTSMRLLSKERIGAVVNLEFLADAAIAANPDFSSILKHPIPVKRKPYYLMLSKGFVASDPELSERVWDEIATIIHSDDYQTIAQKYVH